MQAAGVVTALFFVVWLSTLGVRLTQFNAAASKNTTASTANTLYAVEQASTTLGY